MKFYCIVGFYLLLCVIVNAQPSQQLKEVVIKDNHIQERKRTESWNLDIIDRDYLRRNLGGSLMKSLERLPGIKTIGIGSGQSKPLIRGMGFNRVIVVDKGIKHEGQQWGADHGLEIDQYATGEVSVIRGAASFLYGSDAIGGVIDIHAPALPDTNSTGGTIEIVGKSNNSLYGSSLNFYRRGKRFFFDMRATYMNYGDYKVPTDTVQVYSYAVALHKNRLRNTAGRERNFHLNLGYSGDRFSSVFYISHIHSNTGYFANAHGLEPRRVNTAIHDASDRDILMPGQYVNHFKIINRSSYALNKHLLEIDMGYQQNFRQEFSAYVNHGYMPPVYPDTLDIPGNLERAFKKQVVSLNVRDQITIGDHSLTIGISGETQDNTIGGWTFLVPGFKQITAGVFAYDQYRLNERVLLHTAWRYDYGHIQTDKYVDWFPSEDKHLVRAEHLSREFSSFVWSAGVNYNRDRFDLKANVGKSFRMPIAKELAANGVNYHYFSYERGNANLAPERSYQADLSVGWSHSGISFILSPFYNYFPNYIYLNPTPDHDYYHGAGNQVFEYEQASVVRYGGELRVKYQVLKTLAAEVSGEYLYAKQVSGKKEGYTLPFSPPPSALFNITWTPVSPAYISFDYRITSRQNNIVPPEKKTPGYTLMNIQSGTSLQFLGQPLQINMQVQNILNTKYFNHTSFYRLIELPEEGRNIILSLKTTFK